MRKLYWLAAMMTAIVAVGLIILLSGKAPDSAYKILPTYFADPQQLWKETPLDNQPVTEARIPASVVADRSKARAHANTPSSEKQILFGDTHVHTTNSADAFMYSLPLIHGARGAFPPAYACDYARFVSQLDFFFLTDHAESYTPTQWRDAIEAIKHCNRLAGDTGDADLVAFMGWEWTQVGATAEQHYGHHNVLFKNIEELPARPIASVGAGVSTIASRSNKSKQPSILQWLDPRHKDYLRSYNDWVDIMAATPVCDPDIASPSLPADCYETALTPSELFRKLDQWGGEHLVIPHGMSWGFYTPPGASWEHSLKAKNSDPSKTSLIEVYSGHGNSEVFRDFAVRKKDDNGGWYCPDPQANYLPACWQAGEIIRGRCLAQGETSEECENRATLARKNYVQVDTIHGFLTVPDSHPEEWLDAGQARDVFLPAFNYRPKKSAQYGLALQDFSDVESPKRYRWGFIASTDTHSARAGHGFKQINRLFTADANGVRSSFWTMLNRSTVNLPEAAAHSLPVEAIDPVKAGIYASEFERTTSFMSAGGLAAVHAERRDRDAIWDAMKRREVYGTSGHRILLWFDLLNATDSEKTLPMGSEVTMGQAPRFRVSAKGSFKQLPGCPDYVVKAMAERRLERMSLGECYYPSDTRYAIDRIEVVKITPQAFDNEPVAPLIEDKWKVFTCETSESGCTIEFSDPDFVRGERTAIYYVRAIEEPTATINGANLRASFDKAGEVTEVDPCYGDYRTPSTDDCLAELGQRAWSSPIYVDFER
ncbi:DUF3604 domain-containing protein [Maricurvus nonylphenolicus]|uniref:DUF3604 domain-containing protein n=1 Tax=Maricurvus nonylphenolicus TaxID=1008307 RepID=UPI0036F38E19